MLDEFTYLAGKNDHILDNPGTLVLQELRNDVAADDTGPDNGEVCVSGHGILSDCVRDSWDHLCGALPFLYLYLLSDHEQPSWEYSSLSVMYGGDARMSQVILLWN